MSYLSENMSEEEIIEVLKEFNKIKVNSYAMQFVNIPYPKLQQAINGILELYKAEKEKNKELEKENAEYKVEEDMTFKCLENTRYMSNFISKDKIKEKIEELEKTKLITDEYGKAILRIKIKLLQELLKD